MTTDQSGRYAALYRPYHLIGLELSISVLNAVLNRQPTGATRAWRGDVAAVAKRALKAGETLDGEGGFTVYGKLIPAERSLARGRAADRPRPRRQAQPRHPRRRHRHRGRRGARRRPSPAVRVRREMEAEARTRRARSRHSQRRAHGMTRRGIGGGGMRPAIRFQ